MEIEENKSMTKKNYNIFNFLLKYVYQLVSFKFKVSILSGSYRANRSFYVEVSESLMFLISIYKPQKKLFS